MFRLTSQVFHQSQNEGPTSILAFNICQDLPRYIFSNLITCHLHVPCLIFKPFSLQISGHWTLAQQLMPLLVTVVWMKALKCHFLCTLAWKIPWTEEPGGLQSMGFWRVGHNWASSLQFSLSTFMHWRRKWQPTPVFLPGESWGRRSLVGCRLWGHTESDTTEVT